MAEKQMPIIHFLKKLLTVIGFWVKRKCLWIIGTLNFIKPEHQFLKWAWLSRCKSGHKGISSLYDIIIVLTLYQVTYMTFLFKNTLMFPSMVMGNVLKLSLPKQILSSSLGKFFLPFRASLNATS